jgi:putative lipoic acid-binding regulatory protein
MEHGAPLKSENNESSRISESTPAERENSRSKPRRTGQKPPKSVAADDADSKNTFAEQGNSELEASQLSKAKRPSRAKSKRRLTTEMTEEEGIDSALTNDPDSARNVTSTSPKNDSASSSDKQGRSSSTSRSRSKTKSRSARSEQTVESSSIEHEKNTPSQTPAERFEGISDDTRLPSDQAESRVRAKSVSADLADQRLSKSRVGRDTGRNRTASNQTGLFTKSRSGRTLDRSPTLHDDLFAPDFDDMSDEMALGESKLASTESSQEGRSIIPDWPEDADGTDLIADLRNQRNEGTMQPSKRNTTSKHIPGASNMDDSGRAYGLNDMIGASAEPWDPELLERARRRVQAKGVTSRSKSVEEALKPSKSSSEWESEGEEFFVDDTTSMEYLPLIAPASPFQKAYQRLIHSDISYKELDRWSQGGEPPRVLGVLFEPPDLTPVPVPGQRLETGEGPPLPLPDRMVWRTRNQGVTDVSNTDLLTDIGFASSSDEDIEQVLEDLLHKNVRTEGGRFRLDARQADLRKSSDGPSERSSAFPGMSDEASSALGGLNEELNRPADQDDRSWSDSRATRGHAYKHDPESLADELDPYQLRYASDADLKTLNADLGSDLEESGQSPEEHVELHSSARWGPSRKRYEDEEDQRRQTGIHSARMTEDKRVAGVLTMPETFPAQYELRVLLRNPVPNEAVERILQDIESVLRREVEEDAFWIELVGDMKRVVVRVRVQYQSQVENLYNYLSKHETIGALHGEQIDGIIGRDEEFI